MSVTLYAYEASVWKGKKIHAVLSPDHPLPRQRDTLRYQTLCGHWVSGDRVYRSAFSRERPAVPRCATCIGKVALRRINGVGRIEIKSPE